MSLPRALIEFGAKPSHMVTCKIIRADSQEASCHTILVAKIDRENYIARIVESYIPDGTHEEKMALMAGLWDLLDALYSTFLRKQDRAIQESKTIKYE